MISDGVVIESMIIKIMIRQEMVLFDIYNVNQGFGMEDLDF